MAEPPKRLLSVRMDDALHDNLKVVMRTGMTASDAVRSALGLLAEAYEGAWEMGVCPPGMTPVITGVQTQKQASYDASDTREG